MYVRCVRLRTQRTFLVRSILYADGAQLRRTKILNFAPFSRRPPAGVGAIAIVYSMEK